MMLFFAIFYWALISLHVLGGAALFARFAGKESPWFGFILPPLGFVLLLNFIEHIHAVPSLNALLPFTSLASAWLIFAGRGGWRKLALPTGIFLGAFAFTLTLRAIRPDIFNVSSGDYDLPLIASYCQGQTLPPDCIVFPGHSIGQYYGFVHYAAAVLVRLLHVNLGTGFNLSSALMSAWLCFATAAIAWTVSRHRVGITILAAVMVECASNGNTALLVLTMPDFNPYASASPFDAIAQHLASPVFSLYTPVPYFYSRSHLEVPGFWSWVGTYHATNGGLLLTLLSVWCLTEVLRRKPSNWPWIGLVASPALMVVTSTWGVPMIGVLMLAGLGAAWWYRLTPANPRFVLGTLTMLAILMTPVLVNYLPCAVDLWHNPTPEEARLQWGEFFLGWWPILLPWLFLPFIWPRLSPAVKIVYVVTPVVFGLVEWHTVASRFDMTGKLWGYLWAMSWSVFFPVVARRRALPFRYLTILLLLAHFVSFYGLVVWKTKNIDWTGTGDVLHLEALGHLRTDVAKTKILRIISSSEGGIVLTKSSNPVLDGIVMTTFSGNANYIALPFYVSAFFCPGSGDAVGRRVAEADAFYSGKMADPLRFLRSQKINAVVIWPGDNVSDQVLDSLRKGLAPWFRYQDCHVPAGPNAGVFVLKTQP